MRYKLKLFSSIIFPCVFLTGCTFIGKDLTTNYHELINGENSINPTAIKINKEKLSLLVGQKESLSISFTPEKCNKLLKWTSNAPSIIAVDDVGNVVAKKVGKGVVTAKTINNIIASCEIEVTDVDVEKITLEENDIEMQVDSTYSISNYNVEPSNSLPNIKFEVASNSREFISVDDYGKVTALKSGQGEVYVYDDNNKNGTFNPNSEVFSSLRISVLQKSDAKIETSVNARFFATPLENIDSAPTVTVVTFNMTQAVPYIEASQVNKMFSTYFKLKHKIDNYNIYKKYSDYHSFETNGGGIRFYAKDNVMVLHNWQKYISMFYATNNGLPLDICSPNESTNVKGSSKTKTIKNHEEDVRIQLSDYSLRIIDYNGSLYMPFDIASSFIFHNITNYVFDGEKIYNPSDTINYKNTIPYFLSSNSAFSFYDNKAGGQIVFYKKPTSDSSIKYLYQSTNLDDFGNYINAQMVFKNDGTGSYISGINKTGSYTEFDSDYLLRSFNFTFKLNTTQTTIGVKLEGSSDYDYYINTIDSNFGKNSFPSGYKDYSYYSLCLKLDYFYGLKWKLVGNGSFMDFFKNNEITYYKTNFFSKENEVPVFLKKETIYNLYRSAESVDDVSKIVYTLFTYWLGDGHTGIKYASPLGSLSAYAVSMGKKFSTSDRNSALKNKNSELKNKKITAMSLSQYTLTDKVLFSTDKSLAILQFGSFDGSNIPKNTNYTKYKNDGSLVYSGDSNANHYSVNKETFKNFAKQLANLPTATKNIVVDTTINGGGAVKVVPLLLSFMTSDPTIVVRSTITGGITEYHYEVDLNGDGNYGTANDNLSSNLKFFILQSNYSFSSATAFSACAKINGAATIIGENFSGGGSCVVSYGNDALGNSFQLSGTLEIMMPNNSGNYVSDDNGVPADQIINSDYFYSADSLKGVINNLKS